MTPRRSDRRRRPGIRRHVTRHAGRHAASHDDGTVLPLVLVIVTVMSVVVAALASYLSVDLRYGRVVESRADRLAAADGGLRYGIEKLRLFQTLCTTGAGTGGGYTTIFPPEINGAQAEVTCRRVGSAISDVQGWGVVVTGEGVPPGQPMFTTQGAGGSTGNVKTFSGPIYIADPSRIDLAAILQIEDGDLWYTSSNCDTSPAYIPEIGTGTLVFEPEFLRGPLCTDLVWDGGLFNPPSLPDPPVIPSLLWTTNGSCRVFWPGKYTSMPALDTANYFMSGEYYFEDFEFEVKNQSATFGFPDGAGDSTKVANPACEAAQAADRASGGSGGRGGATIFLGGTAHIDVENGGELEIFRRQQGVTFLSVAALRTNGFGWKASTLGHTDWILETKSGSNNDVAVHGLFWAPYAGLSLGNVTNAANGQLLGGLVIASLDTQASASASAFHIGIESNPVDVRLLLISTATNEGGSTSIRAVVQYQPDEKALAINSWRVSD